MIYSVYYLKDPPLITSYQAIKVDIWYETDWRVWFHNLRLWN